MSEVFSPNLIIDPDSPAYSLEPAILATRESMNKQDSRQIYEDLKAKTELINGLAVTSHASNDSPELYSSTECAVFWDAFGMGQDNARRTRPEFLARMLRLAGIRDTDGYYLPLFSVASPGFGSSLPLSWWEKRAIANDGEFGFVAKAGLKAVEQRGSFQKVHAIGISQNANTVLSTARRSFKRNFDIGVEIACDPTNSEERRPYAELLSDFTKDGDMDTERSNSNVCAQLEGVNRLGMAQLILSGLMPINSLMMARGMAKNRFFEDVSETLAEQGAERITVAYGSQSLMAKPATIEPALAQLPDVFSIRIEGADHAWMENYPLLGKVCLAGFNARAA